MTHAPASDIPPPQSDALRANLLETAVAEVTIDPRQELLREAVAGLAGVRKSLDRLLHELNHPFRNWQFILPELKGFLIKNTARFNSHPRGPECFGLFCDLFFQARDEADRPALVYAALEGLTAYLEKQTGLIPWEELGRFAPVFESVLERLARLDPAGLLLLSQSHTPLKRTITQLARTAQRSREPLPIATGAIRTIALRSLEITYRHWLAQPDPLAFAPPGAAEFQPIAHATLRANLARLQQLADTPPGGGELLEALITMPAYLDVVRGYRQAANALGRHGNGPGGAGPGLDAAGERLLESRKLRFMFHILETEGLSLIHEETLREVNRSLVTLVRLLTRFGDIEEFFLKAFALLKANVVKYPHTALTCIEALGSEVFKRHNDRLVEAFLGQVVRFGFQYSRVEGVTQEWQTICNPAHLTNIRVWLSLIRQNPQWCSTLLSALIINLRLSGTCIRDTDLFQKEVTRLLNSGVAPVYNLMKQFARQLPVYYNEIGAEGSLRDVSTELDEGSRRKDLLIHFLRKQCHVESTNLIVELSRGVFRYWLSGDKASLRGLVADPVLEQIQPRGPWFDDEHAVVAALFREWGLTHPDQLLEWSLEEAEQRLAALTGTPAPGRRRVHLMIHLFQLLHLKYNLGALDIEKPLREQAALGTPGVAALLERMARGEAGGRDLEGWLDALLEALEGLRQVILSPERFPAREEVFQKRHIAVNIPSIYGFYSERKFDALSLSFRLENMARVGLEELAAHLGEGFITRATFFAVARGIRLFLRSLALDGITSRKLQNQLDILRRSLEMAQFSYHQYRDVFQGFAEGVQDLVYTYYTSHHRDTLSVILPTIPADQLLPKYRALMDGDTAISVERVGETLLRDLIAETLGLQSFDNFISRIQSTLARQEGELEPAMLDLLMTYDPANLFCSLERPSRRTRNLIHLGNKGYNLVQMAEQGIPVPPGVILTTEYFRCREVVRIHPPARADYLEQLRKQVQRLERATGRAFGHQHHPLLLSVRSGALISMPGMMQTIHNVGINERIVAGLITHSGNPYFAWDTYRRFIQSWAMTCNVERSVFHDIMRSFKRSHRVTKKREFSATQMRELALAYRDAARREGVQAPEDPWQQLSGAIGHVLDSWSAPKAREYRRLLGISDHWGTAVVIQAMVFGNLHQRSGTGVLFTAHPHRKLNRVVLWGDYTPGNQGEDIVGGLVSTFPISLEQAQADGRDPASSLEECFPEIYQRLLQVARELVYQEGWNPQEMEFTFDGPQADNLFLLQTRDMVTAINKKAVLLNAFKPTPELARQRLAQGIGVSGGALCGRAVFNGEQVAALRQEDPGTPLILIRYDTVPDDIKEINAADGLLTARGGQTSHASIVAVRLDKTCVVGCESLAVREDMTRCTINGQVIQFGDRLGIDGHGGLVVLGWHPVEANLMNDQGRTLPRLEGNTP